MMGMNEMINIVEIESFLKSVEINYAYRNNDLIRDSLSFLKKLAISDSDENLAKKIWIMEQILLIQKKYIDAFFDIKMGNFYNAWCSLENVEGTFKCLNKHFNDIGDNYKINFIIERVEMIQSVFPYKLALSPELILKNFKCSIW
jgi:hypothetical protein